MFLNHSQITPARMSEIVGAAEAAARRVPPAFPLEATVAVNPFLGQTGEDLASAATRLSRVAGIGVTQNRSAYAEKIAAGDITDADLSAALAACVYAEKPADLNALKARLTQTVAPAEPLPTIADLAAGPSDTDWSGLVARCLGLWAAGQFDQGQALWGPAPGRTAFAAWREWASHDLTPELAGLAGFAAHVAACPDTAERAILRAADTLGLSEAAAEGVFHRLFVDMGGWAQHARWLLWKAELAGQTDVTLSDLLAIRLVWEEALFLQEKDQIAARWQQVLKAHAAPVSPNGDQITDMILQEAAERAHQRKLAAKLTGTKFRTDTRPALQAAFCIDVRSEVFRRALETLSPEISTIGFAGFFGLPMAHRSTGSDIVNAHLPVLLNAGLHSSDAVAPEIEESTRIAARASRAWGRFRQAAVSSFAFVEAAGPLYAGKLVRDALGLGTAEKAASPVPRLDTELSAEAKADTAATVLKAMSMTKDHARLVLLLGHGASVTNNPMESAYHCGACGGQTGEVSARLLAQLLNDAETREGLSARGVDLADDTFFVAGLHDTTTDTITLYEDGDFPAHKVDLSQAKSWLADAGQLARAERAGRLPRAQASTISQRAIDWAETRPEWGLAGCAAFVAAPRGATADADLGGRAFLHSYDWKADEGFSVLELILTAPVVVASWISLQYYGSSLAPELFGSGNKLLHNVSGGIGVVEGNGGRLRAGLPLQAVHDGEKLVHEPLRLSVLIEAPKEAISDILARHDGVRELFDNGWLHLLALEQGQITSRYRPGLTWEKFDGEQKQAAA